MSIIARMLDKVFGRKRARLLILGLDSPGRTTALYRLKLGETVTTIPTIGFNVEDVQIGDVMYSMWDVGGRDKIRPLWRHYFQNTSAIIFSVRSSKRIFEEMLDEYKQELFGLCAEDELRDAVLLVWANFQDLPDALTVDQIAEKLELNKLNGRCYKVFGTCAITGDGLYESMSWLESELKQRGLVVPTGGLAQGGLATAVADGGRAVASAATAGAAAVAAAAKSALSAAVEDAVPLKQPSTAKQPSTDEAKAHNMEALLLQWLEEDHDEEETLKSFSEGTMTDLSHRDRLLVAWSLIKKHGRKEAIQQLFEGAKRTLRDRFHETTLYFWLHMVHFAVTSDSTKNPLGTFKGFLLLNPQLVNSDLLLDYYSQEAIWKNPDAQKSVVLPDKKALPSLISPVGEKEGKAPNVPTSLKELSDAEFMALFEQRRLPSWGHDARVRAIFLLLRSEGRRDGGTKRLFTALANAEGGMHRVTDTYFWIQMVTYFTELLGYPSMAASASFADFYGKPQCHPLQDPHLISTHYSDAVLAKGEAKFQPPDKKPLPSVISRAAK